MKQQKAAVNEIERIAGQTSLARASFDERSVGQAPRFTQFTRLCELRPVHVNSCDTFLRTDHLGQHASYYTDATTEIGDLHTLFESRFQKDSPARGGVDVMQHVQAANCGRAGRKRILTLERTVHSLT